MPTLLPRVDNIFVQHIEEKDGEIEPTAQWVVPFDKLLEVPGLMARTEQRLPRWQPTQVSSDEVLDQIGERLED